MYGSYKGRRELLWVVGCVCSCSCWGWRLRGARLVEFSGREYMVRGRGYIKSINDIQQTVVATNSSTGTPILVRDLGTTTLGPDLRRGVAELDGQGEVVGGVVIMRFGENAEKVIERVKATLDELKSTLPPGMEIVPTYDRSELIDRSIENLKGTLIEELIIVSLVIMVFLLHIPSAMVPIITIPLALLFSFIPMHAMGLSANIMSLGGLAIAIGAMVDAAIVMVEQTHKKLDHWEAEGQPGAGPSSGYCYPRLQERRFHSVRLPTFKCAPGRE